ncbi:MAG: Ig-like domain-containing protein [Defluviitaleaceae bacterium]|nr:Ig-like domain-containing protein [Defluviitaleaceae bacterium]
MSKGLSGKEKIIIFSCVAVILAAVISVAVYFLPRLTAVRERPGEAAPADPYAGHAYPNGVPDPAETDPSEGDSVQLPFAPAALGGIQITPLDANGRGVSLDSAFLIKSDVKTLTAEHLKAYLSVPSGEAFALEDNGDNTFLLRFDGPLSHHKIYQFIYGPTGYAPASHAFQTVDAFRVLAVSPSDSSFNIPLNAGIEITFNQPLAGRFEDAFDIYPPVRGHFLQRGDTHIFAPADALQEGTAYTVTVRKGLIGAEGDALTEDETFTFVTAWGNQNTSAFSLRGEAYETFLPWDEVFIALDIPLESAGRDFTVSLYDLHTAENYIHFTGTYTGMRVYELTAVEIDVSDWRSLFYLFLGETLPEGYYVAEIRSANPAVREVAHKFIQVSSLSVYSLAIAGEAVFWVHDAFTGLPAEGARVRVGGSDVITDRNGIAVSPTRQESRTPITVEYGEYLPFAYTQSTFGQRPLLASDRFLFHMYTDRPVYRPNDTVDVFGVIKPRFGHTRLPTDRFTLHIGDMLEIPLTLNAFDTFAVRVPVTGMFGWMDIEVRHNGNHLMSVWPEFLDYTNLSFVIQGEWDKTAYDIDESAYAEISVTNFAGMPMEGVTLRSDNTTLITNENGMASGPLRAEHGHHWATHWMPFWTSHWIWVGGTQNSQGIVMPRIIAPFDIMLEHEWVGHTLRINTYGIRVDRLDAHHRGLPPWTYIEPDTFRGEAVDVDYTIRVTRNVTTRTIRSQRYDHINRRTVTTYNHTTTRDPNYRVIQGRTVNGTASVANLPRSDDPLIWYNFDITYHDTRGRQATVGFGFWHSEWTDADSSIRHFNFVPENNRLRIGETTRITLTEGRTWDTWYGVLGETAPVTNGRVLAVMIRDGVILSVNAGDPGGVPVVFPEEGISNAFVLGAYFDGRYIYPVTNPAALTFDHTEREIGVELDFCRERYKPGDEVTVTVSSAADAQLLISVVDESAFLGRRHNADFLPRLYQSARQSLWSIRYSQFASHTQHEFGTENYQNGWGGNGDGDAESFRDDFTDNPVFELIRTDADGKAVLTFTLPHQVTSWRVTAIALTENGSGGDVREHVISALDFYVDLLLTTEYIIGDDIAAAARVHGAGGEAVDFTFEILQDGERIYTHTVNAARRAEFNAGKLAIGEYTMRVTAVSGNRRDAVELPFSVARSGLIIENRIGGQISPGYNGSGPAQFAMRDLPVRISLTNAAIWPLTHILSRAGDSRSSRTDYRAAAAYRDYFFTGEANFCPTRSEVHRPSGGIAELVYEEAEFFYTARFAASFPEFVNRNEIIRYMEAETPRMLASVPNITSAPIIRAARLLALAAIGEPVLLCIQNEAELLASDSYMAWLYLTAALVAIGDDAGAMRLFTSMPPSPNDSMSEQDRETAATLRLFINTALEPQAALNYIFRSGANQFVSDVPERINFVRRTRLSGGTVSEVSYTLHGQTHTVRLENFDRHTLRISREQFEALDLTPVSGDTEYHITFYGYDHSHWDAANNRAEIHRTITPAANGLYRVELSVSLPPGTRGSFTVYDRIPSNMRFAPVQQRWQQGTPSFTVWHTQRQLVEMGFVEGHRGSTTRTMFYYVSPLFEGDMAEGTTYIINRNANNPIWGMTG